MARERALCQGLAFALWLWCLLSLLSPLIASAHGFDPVALDLREAPGGAVVFEWRGPRYPALRLVLPPRCTAAPPALARGTLSCTPPGLAGALLALEGLGAEQDVLVRATLASGARLSSVLTAASPRVAIPDGAAPASPAGWAAYLALGLRHIGGGSDHLLFVLALVLLVSRPRRLLLTLTAFTLAHSLSLALCTLGLLTLPPPPVEAAIALSVLLLAAQLASPRANELAAAVQGRAGHYAMALVCGLLHGLGFAGALRERGFDRGELLTALVAFNCGVELGQLLFVGALILAWRVIGGGRAVPPRLRRGLAYGIGAVAAAWLWARVAAFWS